MLDFALNDGCRIMKGCLKPTNQLSILAYRITKHSKRGDTQKRKEKSKKRPKQRAIQIKGSKQTPEIKKIFCIPPLLLTCLLRK